MADGVLAWFRHLPGPLAVFVIAMLPIFELRGAIPFGYAVGAGPPLAILLIAVAGNAVPVLPLLVLLGPAERWLRRWRPLDRLFAWVFARTLRRSEIVRRYQAAGLVLLVAIPLPMTGAWTGAIAAYLLKLPLRLALPCIILGILIAGVVVTLAVEGVVTLWSVV